jgi:spore coat protein U-like protein
VSRAWLLVLLLALAPPSLRAAAVCRLLAPGGIAFGSYDLLATAPRDSQMTLAVRCEGQGTAQNVTLSVRIDGGGSGAPVQARRMLHTGGTGDTLAYGLFRDAARSAVWGVTEGVDTVGALLAVPAVGAVSFQFTVFGRIPARQDARVGSYADAVQLTVNY